MGAIEEQNGLSQLSTLRKQSELRKSTTCPPNAEDQHEITKIKEDGQESRVNTASHIYFLGYLFLNRYLQEFN